MKVTFILIYFRPSAITVKSESNNSYTDKSGGYTRTVNESSRQIVTESTSTANNTGVGGGYSSLSRFRPIESTLKGVIGAQAIRVQDIPNGAIGRPVEFEIDGSKAGSGNLEILVNGGRVTSSVRSLGGQRFVASFTPHEPGIHTVQITFNGETVPGKILLIIIVIMAHSHNLTLISFLKLIMKISIWF